VDVTIDKAGHNQGIGIARDFQVGAVVGQYIARRPEIQNRAAVHNQDGIVVIDQTIRVGACERVAGERHGRAAQGRDRGFGGLGINCHGAIIASWDSAANDPARPLIETAVEGVMGPSEIRGK
jgi:hypothetical protein